MRSGPSQSEFALHLLDGLSCGSFRPAHNGLVGELKVAKRKVPEGIGAAVVSELLHFVCVV